MKMTTEQKNMNREQDKKLDSQNHCQTWNYPSIGWDQSKDSQTYLEVGGDEANDPEDDCENERACWQYKAFWRHTIKAFLLVLGNLSSYQLWGVTLTTSDCLNISQKYEGPIPRIGLSLWIASRYPPSWCKTWQARSTRVWESYR